MTSFHLHLSAQNQGNSAEASTPHTVELRGAPFNITEVSPVTKEALGGGGLVLTLGVSSAEHPVLT